MDRLLVSVITPVHDSSAWLSRCIESALCQTLQDIEIICIDDGSTDGSPAILRDFAGRDSRVRVIAFERNRGVSAARNAALDSARGEYVFFLDSDDWIDPDHLEAMYRCAAGKGLDVLINTRYDLEWDDGRTERGSHFGIDAGAVPRPYPASFVQSHVLCALCFRMYRREYLDRNNIRFPLIKGGGEDIYFTGLAEALVDQVYVFDGPCYHYFQHDGSVVHMKDRALPYIRNFDALYDELCARGIPCDDFKMLYCGVIELDTREKFDFVKRYITKVEAIIRKHPEYYTGHDLLLTDVVLVSRDYDDFRQHHHPNIVIEYIRSKMRRNG